MCRTEAPLRLHTGAAFTLIELLVVIAIIAVLAAILFPVFAQAREKARQATCASNLHQLGLACTQYFEDYDEMVFQLAYQDGAGNTVSWDYWYDATFHFDYSKGLIQPYLKNFAILECPTARSIPLTPPHSPVAVAYGLNVTYLENPNYQGDPNAVGAWSGNNDPISTAQVQEPTETILMGDSAWLQNGLINQCDNVTPISDQWCSLHARHNSMAEILWFDGHVKGSRLVTPTIDRYGNTPAQLQAANMGTLLKFPYTGNGKYDDYYFATTKFSPP